MEEDQQKDVVGPPQKRTIFNEDERVELAEHFRERSILFLTVIIDTVFVLGWLALQVGAAFAINWLVPNADGTNRVLLVFLQIAFAVATAWPIANSIYVDIRVAIIKGNARIRRVEQQINAKEKDSDTP